MTENREKTFECHDCNEVYVNYDALNELSVNNADYFNSDTSSIGKKIHATLLSIIDNLETIRPLVDFYRGMCPDYDFDEKTPGNGYRSYVLMTDAFVVYGVKVSKQICLNRNSYFFRRGTALKELEVVEQGLGSLAQMLTHLKTLVSWCDKGCLYPREEHPPEELLHRAQNLNQYCFYGRCLGFQFCESIHTILKGLGILMASFSEMYYSNGGVFERATSSLWNSSKYLVNPELRARRIVNISQYASVNFCKQFWFLGEMEMMKRLPSFVTPSLLINRVVSLPPEPLTITSKDGQTLNVPIPSAHIGMAPLNVRLMSAVKREGMMGEASNKDLASPSRGLFFHCHGGGFVAQSSRSHETYLCQWAKAIDAPILSVDYSLAPEAPFPRALEETYYAYCWALKHAALLGTTAERIVAGGDSAGGNLCLGLTLKCIETGVRPPDGLFLAYTPVVVSFVPSPARLLCLMDPLLPLGFLTGCLRAYACTPEAYSSAVKGFEEKLRRSSRKQGNTSASTEPVLVNGNGKCVKEENSDEIFEKYVKHDANGLETIAARNGETTGNGNGNVIAAEEVPEDPVVFQDTSSSTLHTRLGKAAGNFASAMGLSFKGSKTSSTSSERSSTTSQPENEEFEEIMLPCPIEMLKFEVPHNPLLSPYYATDEAMKQFPPVSLMTLHMDPCLDDCVQFAKKLKGLNKEVRLDILEGLPHGFLNFSLLSKEAYEGSKLCIERIKTLLDLSEYTPVQDV